MDVLTSLGPVSVLTVTGDIDGETFRDLVQQAETVLAQGYYQLVLDLHGVNYISSAGLVAIQSILGKVTGQAGRLVVTGLNPRVARVLDISGASGWLQIYPDLASAKASFDV